jgi:hypothetical protein
MKKQTSIVRIGIAILLIASVATVGAARFSAEKALEYTWTRDPLDSSRLNQKAEQSETFNGHLMPFKCRNDEPVEHTTECALLPACLETGFGLRLADGTFLKFDDMGSKHALAALKATQKKNDLKASVKGRRSGDSIIVESLELK